MGSEQKCKQLFAECDADSSGVIDYNEFLKAIDMLQDQVADESLSALGLSVPVLFGILLSVVFLLLALLCFVLFGIAAFTENSSFGSVINSLLAAGGGGAAGAGGNDGGNEEDTASKVTDT